MMQKEDRIELNGMKVFPFSSPTELLHYVDRNKGILVAVNAEKVTKATDETRVIVNENIGYADGQEVIDATVSKLKEEFEGINIVGYRNGYIQTQEEREELIRDVAARKPDVVFVAMGSPLQEFLMADMMKVHPAIYQGLGGSFDVYTGRVKRAPLWWQKHNLEFLYRFLKQPQRYRREYYRLKFLAWMMMGRFSK